MLKAILDSVDGLGDELKAEYRPGTAEEGLEGKFVLDVEAVNGLALENVEGLKTTLGAKKAEVEEAKSKLARFGDMNPEQAKAALAKVAELGDIDPEKEADKLVEQKVAAIKQQLIETHQAEKEALETRLRGRDSLLERVLVEDQAIRAITEQGGDVDLLLPHVKPNIRLKLEEADDGTIKPATTIIDAQGNPRISGSKGENMDVTGLVTTMKSDEKFSRLFKSSGHQGSGSGDDRPSNPGQRPEGKPSTWSRRQKIDYVNEHGQEAYNDLAASEG